MASNSSSSNLFFPSQTPASPNFLCKVCLRSFHSERGLLLHRKAISKCNRLTEHITSNSSSSNLYSPSQTPSSPNFLYLQNILPSRTIKEFHEIFVYYIHEKLSKNHTIALAGRRTISSPCTSKVNFSHFRGFIHTFQVKRGI
ncbi:hypothetical protein RhiirB3_442265 [Rhizophagus irregularis]|nr:hypothetical protein RhiirB3_442265 [Rhizophagus irregularis]